MSSKELKRDYMTKRSHMKRKFTSDNFKSRWFMLFEDCLKYYEGTLEKGPGKEKGVIRLDTVHAIEEADLQPFDANKKHGFQVPYFGTNVNISIHATGFAVGLPPLSNNTTASVTYLK